MPNWTENSVILHHSDPSKIAALKEQLETASDSNAEYFFNYLRPRPADKSEDWYDWNVENWGTKWDSNPSLFEIDNNNICLDFQTAWGPPIALYEYLTNEGWGVDALYAEPGVGFCGSFTEGVDECYSYDITNPESYELIPDEVSQYAGIDIMVEDYNESKEEE